MLTGTPGAGDAVADPKRRECELPFGKGVETAFADGYPFLIATEVSCFSLMKEAEAFQPCTWKCCFVSVRICHPHACKVSLLCHGILGQIFALRPLTVNNGCLVDVLIILFV